MATFVEQSHLNMPPPGWLHVNGVSLSTDIQQQPPPTNISDDRTKTGTSPIPPESKPFTAVMNDGQQTIRQYKKFENVDLPKKLFIDRQIKKARSLPGLIKGTALSHHMTLHSAPFMNPIHSNPSASNSQDDPLPVSLPDHDEDSPLTRQHDDRTNDSRRLRVSFSDINKVQFIDGNTDTTQQPTHRRHRHRSSKKATAMPATNHVSPPSIQHSQTLFTPFRPLSRQQSVGQELHIRKQPLVPSPRLHSSRVGHLPDILNQSLAVESVVHEKYPFQREKVFIRFPEPAMEMPVNSSAEISRESTRAGGYRSTGVIQDSHDHHSKFDGTDQSLSTILNSSSISSSLTSRQRPLLRSISLRQQFMSPLRIKPTNIINNPPLIVNPRRSASLKQSNTYVPSLDDDPEDVHNHGFLSTLENRPMTGVSSSKHVKRNYLIHFNSKNPFNGNSTMDSYESNRHSNKSHLHESSEERFQNVLKISRPPYITSVSNSNDETIFPKPTNNTNGSVRSSRTNSGREFHITTNTIFV